MTRARWQAANVARSARADAKAATLAPVITELQSDGVTSARALARALTERGIPTPRGASEWCAAQVLQVFKRLGFKGQGRDAWMGSATPTVTLVDWYIDEHGNVARIVGNARHHRQGAGIGRLTIPQSPRSSPPTPISIIRHQASVARRDRPRAHTSLKSEAEAA
jgi:hypothetical protein